jgi:hypothetical protein
MLLAQKLPPKQAIIAEALRDLRYCVATRQKGKQSWGVVRVQYGYRYLGGAARVGWRRKGSSNVWKHKVKLSKLRMKCLAERSQNEGINMRALNKEEREKRREEGGGG